jgi:2-aminoadipate transaminase
MKKLALSALGRRTGAPPISWLMALTLERPKLVSLAAGFTDAETLPVQDVRELLDEILSCGEDGQAALQYGTTAGDPLLRRLTAERLRVLDGCPSPEPAYSPERLILTSGSQQILYMVSEALCDPGDIVLVEDPTYFVYLGIVESHGLQARGVRMEKDGVDLAHLEAVLEALKRTGELRRVKLLYLISYHQNPTGISTSFQKKAGVLVLLRRYEQAAGHPIYLLEDAAYRELRFQGSGAPSALAEKAHRERVIYAGTYSKPFATGTRVGFGLLPEPLLTTVLRIKGNHDFGSSNLLQQLLARAISSGRYEKHLGALRHRYARKARVMAEAMRAHFPPGVEWQTPEGGLYYWVRLPRRLKSSAKSPLFQAALSREVLYVPGQLCYAEDPARRRPDHEMRLSFGAAGEKSLVAGIERLGGALHQLLDN